MDSLTETFADVDLVVGVDTHKPTHAAAVVDVDAGARARSAEASALV